MALKKQEVKSSLSEEMMNQFQNNFTAHQEVNDKPEVVNSTLTSKTKKPNYKNIFNVHMGTGDKARLKSFCAAREIPINTFILFAIEHLIDEIEDGKCTVSKSGIRILKKEA